jgi:hypothetical protein
VASLVHCSYETLGAPRAARTNRLREGVNKCLD